MPSAARHRAVRSKARHRGLGGGRHAGPIVRIGASDGSAPVTQSSTYARHIGRIGALAVALGVGVAVVSSYGAGVARADEGADSSAAGTASDSSTPATSRDDATSSTSPSSAGTSVPATAADVAPNPTGPAGSASATQPTVPDMNFSNTGGAHTSSTDTTSTAAPSTNDDAKATATGTDSTQAVPVGGDALPSAPASASKTPAVQNNSPIQPPRLATVSEPVVGSQEAPATRDVHPSTVASSATEVATTMAVDIATPDTAKLASAPEAVAPGPLEAPAEEPSVISTILAAAIAPFVLPGPTAPVTSPLLWAVLAWSRRESDVASDTTTGDTLLAARTTDGLGTGPVAVDDTYAVDEDGQLLDDVLTNDDIPGTAVATLETPPGHGTVVLSGDGQFTYTPDADFSGGDTFSYTIADQDGLTSTASVSIVVIPSNDPPVGADTSVSITEDGSYHGTLPPAVDVDGDQLTYGLAGQPANGTAVVDPDGTYSYTPAADFHGADGFFYTVSDGTVTIGYVVTVTVAPVNDAPVGSDVITATAEDASTGGVLPVSDVDGDPISYALTSPAAHGVAVVNADGTYGYRPDPNFNGTDSFGFSFSDGTETSTRTVTITVTPVNDPPQSSQLTLTIDEDTRAQGMLHASDVDGDTITYALYGSPMDGTMVFGSDGSYTYTPNLDYHGTEYITYRISDGQDWSQYTINITIDPVNDPPIAKDASFDIPWGGTLSETVRYLASDVDYDQLTFALHQAGSGSVALNPDGTFTYTAGPGFSGPDAFTYVVTDAAGATAVGTVTVQVANSAPLPTQDVYVVQNGAPLHVDASKGLLGNDYDPGDTLTVVSFGTPGHGTVTGLPDGSFTYTPATGTFEVDEFTYVVQDLAGTTANGRVVIYFEQANRPPVAVDYHFTIEQGRDHLVFNPLDDASDPDGDPLLVRNVSAPGSGFTQAITGGGIAYEPDPTFVGADSFTYQLFDGYQYVTASVTVTVNPATAFDAVDDDFDVAQGATNVMLDALKNDTSPGNDLLLVEIDSETTGGKIGFDSTTRTFVYTPFAGTQYDSFSYKITDPGNPLRWDYATVNITVVPPGEPPIAEDDWASTPMGEPVTIDVLENDWDPDGGKLFVKLDSQPTAGGKAGVGKDGTITFTPEKGFIGTVQFGYSVIDEDKLVSHATVTIDVYDPAPPSHDKSYTVGKDGTLTVSVEQGVLIGYGSDGWTAGVAEKPRYGQVKVNEDGSFTYTPNKGFVGTDTFVFFASTGEMGDTAMVTIAVTGTAIASSAGSGLDACGTDWWPRQNGADQVWPLCLYPEARRPSEL